jgi:hypothetical protein
MSQEDHDRRIDYVEFQAVDIAASKRFYSALFGWEFTDYAPEYTSFGDGRLSGGFTKVSAVAAGGPLIVIYATELDRVKEAVAKEGGVIVKDTFEFPGGRRFHFHDPNGNELAVWSDK